MSTTLENYGGGVDSRPEECECLESFHDLACWSCYRAGFEEPNPNPPEDDS